MPEIFFSETLTTLAEIAFFLNLTLVTFKAEIEAVLEDIIKKWKCKHNFFPYVKRIEVHIASTKGKRASGNNMFLNK